MNNLPGMLYQALNDPPNFTFTFVSEGCKALTGYTPEELMSGNLKFMNIVNAYDFQQLEKLHQVTLSVGMPLETTFRITTKDGKEKFIWMRSRVVDTNEEGMPHLIEGFFTDLTKRLRIETAKLANRAKLDFLTKMSHEIRTPMNTIIGMAEIGLREDIPDNIREYTHSIKNAGGKLISILNDILDYTNIKNDEPQLFVKEYMLSSLINDVVSTVKAHTANMNLEFMVYVDSKIPNMLIGDLGKLRQIMLNILSNAVKFTDEGFVSLSIDGEISDNTVNLTITVEDTGRGIKEEDMGNLFKEFFQFDTKVIEGTGLGLYIAHNFAELMGGEIHASSMPNVGSIFTVTLPQQIHLPDKVCEVRNLEENKLLIFEHRKVNHRDYIIRTMENLGITYDIVETVLEFHTLLESGRYTYAFVTDEMHRDFKKEYPNFRTKTKILLITEPFYCLTIADILNDSNNDSSNDSHITANNEDYVKVMTPQARVLVIDDIRANLVVAKGLLQPYKMYIDLCESGAEAIEAVKYNRYDLIFMDYMMPVMDGVEAVSCIRALDDRCQTDCKKVPIVALTANVAHGTWEKLSESGFNDFLPKPIDTAKLNAIIEKWLSKEKQKNVVDDITEISDLKIKGIDVNKGLAMSGGNLDIYLQVIEVYYKDGLKLVGELKNCLEKDNIELFKIHVHALKSASATIGADKVSKAAAAMELAAEQGDLAFVQAEGPWFLIELKTLLNNIFHVVMNNMDKPIVSTDALKSDLVLFKNAINTSDAYAINEYAKKLQVYLLNEKFGDVINSILINKIAGKYDDVLVLIDTILEV